MTLTKPDFVEKQSSEVIGLYCKVCGVKIAGVVERIKGDPTVDRFGSRVVTKIERFTRFSNFTEMKIALANGHFHITTGCSKCLTHGASKDLLRELMHADIEEQRPDLGNIVADQLKARVPLTVVGIKEGGGLV